MVVRPGDLVRARGFVDGVRVLPGDGPGRAGELSRLCSAVVRVVPAAGAGMTVTLGGAPPMALAASSAQAERLEELQLTLGEGPCVDAVRHRRPVLEPDLQGGGSRRWLAYGPAAHRMGVAAVFAFPLQVGAVCLGVLDVYRDHVGSLSPSSLADALAFAEVAVEVLLDDQQEVVGREHLVLGEGLTPLELYRAQGMVMVQLGVSLTEAMVRIRGAAYADDRRVVDIATDITSGELTLAQDAPRERRDRHPDVGTE